MIITPVSMNPTAMATCTGNMSVTGGEGPCMLQRQSKSMRNFHFEDFHKIANIDLPL